MGSHLTDPWFWVLVVLGLVFWLLEQVLRSSDSDFAVRWRSFTQFRYWPAFFAFLGGGGSYALLDDPALAGGAAGLAYFLTGFNPKSGRDEPWLAKNTDLPRL